MMENPSQATIYPLSPIQHGILFHSLQEPSKAYAIQVLARLQEAPDMGAFECAWEKIVHRHEALRTSIEWRDLSRPLQKVHPRAALQIHQHDLRGIAESSLEDYLQELLVEERKHAFEFSSPPLMRLSVLRRGHDDWYFVWTIHHVIVDGRSVAAILREVFEVYDALRAGRDLALEPACGTKEYVSWIDRQEQNAGEGYWQDLFRAVEMETGLPCSSAQDTPSNSASWSEEPLHLPQDLGAQLAEIASQLGVTMSTVVHGAWGLLLGRCAENRDVIFGTTKACYSGRTQSKLVVGVLINTLPVRARIQSGGTVATLLQDLRTQQLALRALEHSQLTKIRQCADIPAELPLFESIVVFDRSDLNLLIRPEGDWPHREFRLITPTPNYPLVLIGHQHPQLALRISYDPQRFSKAAIQKMAAWSTRILIAIAEDLKQPVSSVELLDPHERKQVIEEWNRTRQEFRTCRCIHELFEEQAQCTPDAVALQFEDRQLTYRELDRRSNQLARYLRRRGVWPEVMVGICLERSTELVEALLGVLKAGAAYVPLDPEYPQDRLRFMLQDASLPVVLTDERLADVALQPAVEWIVLSRSWDQIAQESIEKPKVPVRAENLAYVLYTSGSTGCPKGAALSHRNAVSMLEWARTVFPRERIQSILCTTSICFDLSVFELFLPIIHGGRAVITNRLKLWSSWLDKDVQLVNTVPSLVEGWLQEYRLPESVQVLTLAGESLQPMLVEKIRRLNPSVEIFNLYGPTECTTYSAACRVGMTDVISIGKPIANTRAYVLDQKLWPVPVGIVGELHLGGEGLARGYLNRPDLTAEKFVPDPFSDSMGERIYRTGDRVRWLEDGSLEYLGRLDEQVKVRGHRIELGEIEARLGEHPAVREVAVAVRQNSGGDKRLVAFYCQSSGEEAVSANQLRSHLSARLPEYMVPAAYVCLESLPLTANGKLDRKALPAPGSDAYALHSYEPPVGETETALAGIWSELLKLQRVGRNDNFFALGGHSLLALRVVSRVRQALGVEISISDLFAHPSLFLLAEHLVNVQLERLGPADLMQLLQLAKES